MSKDKDSKSKNCKGLKQADKFVAVHRNEQQLVAKAAARAVAARAIHPRSLRALAAKLSAATQKDKGWTMVTDGKDPDPMTEIMVSRAALASVYGNKPVQFVLPLSHNWASTSGVLSNSYLMLINAAPEWASLAVLFDEWRPEHGHFAFNAQYSALPVLSGNSCFLALGFDPADGANPVNVREVAELKQHQLYRPVIDVGPTGTAVQTSFRTKSGAGALYFPYTLKGVEALVLNASSAAEFVDGWRATKSTTNTNYAIGYGKIYAEMAAPANAVAVAGIWYHTVLFRSRT